MTSSKASPAGPETPPTPRVIPPGPVSGPAFGAVSGLLPGSLPLEITALTAVSSPDFLRAVFGLYRRHRPFALTRPGLDLGQWQGLRVTEHLSPEAGHGWVGAAEAADLGEMRGAELAQISFSSGTEGRPKAILLSRDALGDTVVRLNDIMQTTGEIREYIGVPVTYSFGLGRARAALAAGGQAYLPPRGFDPSEIREMLRRDEINALSAVPSLWRVLLSRPEVIGPLGARVRWIEIGSQLMSAEEKAAMARLFPEARIVQHYGLTEASRATFLVISDIARQRPELLGSVGRPTGGVEVMIGGDNGAPGEAIRIRGPNLGMAVMDEAGHLRPLRDDDGWLTTRDRGTWRDDQLWYLGRLDDQINIGGIKVGAEALEREINAAAPAEGLFAITATEDAMRGNAVLLALEAGASDRRELLEAALRRALRLRGIAPEGAVRVLELETLPRTETGKIRRAALRGMQAAPETAADRAADTAADTAGGDGAAASSAAQAACNPNAGHSNAGHNEDWGDRLLQRMAHLGSRLGRRPAGRTGTDTDDDTGPGSVAAVFAHHFPGRSLEGSDSFAALGGDSLTYIGVAMDLERVVGAVPPGWEQMSLDQLSALSGSPAGRMPQIETGTLLRCMAIILVVSSHFHFINYGGGAAFFLLVVAGYNFAMFQARDMAETGRPWPALRLCLRVALPTMAYILMMSFVAFPFEPRILFLVSNFSDPHLGGGAAYWYVELYLQIMLIMILLFLLPPFRAGLRRAPFGFTLGLLLAATALASISFQLWDTDYLYRRVPNMLLWLFVTGMAAQLASRTSQRILLTLAFALAYVLFCRGWPEAGFLPLAVLAQIWLPALPAPGWLRRPVQSVADASLFIYLTHFQVAGVATALFGAGPGLRTLAAVLGGILLWRLYSSGLDLLWRSLPGRGERRLIPV